MELKILEERPNPLMKRVEYRFEVDHATQATPSRDAVRTELAKALKAPKDRVVIERMHARFGTAHTVGSAAAYQTGDALKAVVRDHIQVRNGFKAKEVKGPAAASEAPPAPPAPAEKPAAEAPKEKAGEKQAGKPAGKHPEKPSEKAVEKGTEGHSEKSAEKPHEKDRAAKKGSDKAHATPAPEG